MYFRRFRPDAPGAVSVNFRWGRRDHGVSGVFTVRMVVPGVLGYR